MGNEIVIQTLEELQKFLNDKGVLEIAIRDDRKRFQLFQKILIQKLQVAPDKKELADKVIHAIKQKNKLNDYHSDMLNQVANVGNIGLLLNALNLCATVAGFFIMYEKLNEMSERLSLQLKQLDRTIKKAEDRQSEYEFNKILSEHNNMLDCRRIGQPYSEERMRELLDAECNLLRYLIRAFKEGLTDKCGDLITSIFTLLSMFTVTLLYFDEVYYYNHLENLKEKYPWHSSHKNWMSIYREASMPIIIEKLQDYAVFEMGLPTVYVDSYYLNLMKHIRDMREEVEDNQKLLIAAGSAEQFHQYKRLSADKLAESIKTIFEESGDGLDAEEIESAYQMAMTQVTMI